MLTFQLFRRAAAALPGMDSRDKPESGEGLCENSGVFHFENCHVAVGFSVVASMQGSVLEKSWNIK